MDKSAKYLWTNQPNIPVKVTNQPNIIDKSDKYSCQRNKSAKYLWTNKPNIHGQNQSNIPVKKSVKYF